MNLATRLRDLRVARGLTQRELADNVNLSCAAIGLYETGKRFPRRDQLEELADYFNVSIDYLTGRDDVTERFLTTDEIRVLDAFRGASDEIRAAVRAVLRCDI